jgi:penicillin-binding protein 1B
VAIKVKIPKNNGKGILPRDPLVRFALLVFLTVSLLLIGFFSYFYVKYDRIIEARFKGPVFSSSARIYADPQSVHLGEKIDVKEIAALLRHAGYADQDGQSPLGTYRVEKSGIQVNPGPESYHSPDPAEIHIAAGKVDSITDKSGELEAYELEPVLVTSLFNADRAKRQVITYDEIPKTLVDAVISIEDRRFFHHGGVNYARLIEAAWIDFTRQKHEQGGSTITMQLSRAFFLSPEKTIKRKAIEMLIAIELERKFSKQQIFEFYANRVDLGQRGSFTISGFGEASRAYFNKDLKDVTLPEAALLAGLIQAPSYLSPYRHPERALERRNLVLDAMFETHSITKEQEEKAKPAMRLISSIWFATNSSANTANASSMSSRTGFTRPWTQNSRELRRRLSTVVSSWWTSKSRKCAPGR